MDISIRGVNKTFGGTRALKDISIDIKSGKFITLLGPSGCGKTTLLRIVAGLEMPDSGEIYFGDRCVFSKEKRINIKPQERNLGMVFQDFALWPHMTVFENVAFSLKARGIKKDIKNKVKNLLKTVRLDNMEKRYPHQMSGGQQQRIAFARAIASNPSIILFDEPLSALDAVLRDEMRMEISLKVRNMNLTSIYVTHDQLEAMSMSDMIIVMNKGEIIQRGVPEEIYNNPESEFVTKFVGKSNWFNNKNEAIRPENISFKPIRDGRTVKGIVKDIGFIGDKYEVNLYIENVGEWLVFSKSRFSIGKEVDIYFTSESIINFNK
jgi:iron(III) transport system ATP-binding protein